MINIIVISDIKIYRDGLKKMLSDKGAIRVESTAESCESAKIPISRIDPLIILLDMTTAGSCKLAQQISQEKSETKIVALAVPYNEKSIIRYAEAGITCYVPRKASIHELIIAIEVAANGECYCPSKIAAFLLSRVRSSKPDSRENFLPRAENPQHTENELKYFSQLTPRERQVVSLLSEGLSNKLIAKKLSIEISTVKNHVHNLLVKLKVKNRSQIAFLLQGSTPYFSNFNDRQSNTPLHH